MDVQRVVSTAVAGLDAKPILDIAVVLGRTVADDSDQIVRRLERGGFQFISDHGPDGGVLFVRAVGAVRIVHLHLLPATDPEWTRHLQFRDYLRASPRRRQEYQQPKRELAIRFPTDRVAYTKYKAAFVIDTLRLAAERGFGGPAPPPPSSGPRSD